MNEIDVAEYEEQGFEGVDVSLDISLNEYRLIWKDLGSEIKAVFLDGYNNLDYGFWSKETINSALNNGWVEKNSVLSYVGMTEAEWNKMAEGQKLFDLFNYYGSENIQGL